ncbi:MAG: methionyl-tRNA formyltransferase [Pseudomonadota bacterium]
MALVNSLVRKDLSRPTLHKGIEASYSFFEHDGRRLLQIDSFGTTEREMPGKKSQTLQFDDETASQLFAILKREFGFK